MREKMLEDINIRMAQLQVVEEEETKVVFECDTRQLEQTISVLGQLIERYTISNPEYPSILQPRFSVGKQGTAEGELDNPRGVAVDEKSKLIYIANTDNISIFSMTGEFIDRFCMGQVIRPYGIAISGNNVFVSDSGSDCLYKFLLPKFQLLTKVGKEGTGVDEFRNPNYLTVTRDKYVLVADCFNDRIVVMNPDLKHTRYFKHHTLTRPFDVKVKHETVYTLSNHDRPHIHTFVLYGEYDFHSFVARDIEGIDPVRKSYSFCIDKEGDILITDITVGNIKVFSQEGVLLDVIRETQFRKIIQPHGITLTNRNKIICTSYETNFGLHIC